MEKYTKRQMFERIITTTTDSEIVEFAKHEIEILEKRSKPTAKELATKRANETLAYELFAVLAQYPDGLTCTELIKASGKELSTQKTASLIALLKDKVSKETAKGGKTVYRAIEG